MIIPFDHFQNYENFKGGEKHLEAHMFYDGVNRMIKGVLIPGASIGTHCHETSSEAIYVLDGNPKFIIDGVEERLCPGECHYCPKGSTHTMINDTKANVLFFAVVPEQ